MKFTHPFSKYGLALVLLEDEIESIDEITPEILKKHLVIGLSHYRVQPKNEFEKNNKTEFRYLSYDEMLQHKELQSSGDTHKGIYLTPNTIATDYRARHLWNKAKKFIEDLENSKDLSKPVDLTKSIAPISNKFNIGSKLRFKYPQTTFLEACLCAIAATTPYKPSLAFKTTKSGQNSYTPQAVIPDLSVKELVRFIELFKMILQSRTEKLMVGSVQEDKNEKRIYFRPRIHRGNFPFAPQSSSLASMGLLAAIGRWAEDAEYRAWAEEVLKSLTDAPIYLISYDDSKTTTYNHYVVELAKENELDKIIYGLEKTELYGEKKRDLDSPKYQQFSLFASRFLQLFNPPAFRDFLAFRAEYKPEMLILLQTYFGDVMNISSDIIQSSMALGLWLNKIAYFTAKDEVERSDKDDKLSKEKKDKKIRKLKAKTLVELESTALSAKTESALISQIIARAGRLSGSDAPTEAKRFMEATISGQIPFDDARNLLIAFSRVRGE